MAATKVEIDEIGTRRYYVNGKRHREDGPAYERANGDRFWYQNGQRHRDNDLPAVDSTAGSKAWFRNGKLHRDNGPAIEYSNGTKEYYLNGERVTDVFVIWLINSASSI
jgi:hypothetical protein